MLDLRGIESLQVLLHTYYRSTYNLRMNATESTDRHQLHGVQVATNCAPKHLFYNRSAWVDQRATQQPQKEQ